MSVHSDDIALKCARPRLLHRVYTNSKNCVFISFFREISPHFGSLPPPEGSSTLPPALVVSPVVGFLFSPGRQLNSGVVERPYRALSFGENAIEWRISRAA